MPQDPQIEKQTGATSVNRLVAPPWQRFIGDVQPLSQSDLPITPQGTIYHLDISPEEIATNVVVCGDPARTEQIGHNLLAEIEISSRTGEPIDIEHRGLRTVTGYLESGLRVSIITHGMGEASAEIAMNEILALWSIDFETRLPKSDPISQGTVIRVGTSGSVQGDLPLGQPIISSYAVSVGALAPMYQDVQIGHTEAEIESLIWSTLNDAVDSKRAEAQLAALPPSRRISVAVTACNRDVVAALENAARDLGVETRTGVTVSLPGFYGSQGRDLFILKLAIKDIDLVLSKLALPIDQRIENFEMEAGTVAFLLNDSGHRSASICTLFANRRTDRWDSNPSQSPIIATKVALRALEDLARS